MGEREVGKRDTKRKIKGERETQRKGEKGGKRDTERKKELEKKDT